jgi:2-oxoisovalerate dehydrogenase E1 component
MRKVLLNLKSCIELVNIAQDGKLSQPMVEAVTTMTLIRSVEQRLLDLFAEGKLAGTTHTSIGQEACAVGVISALDSSRDIVFSTHRCHGHYIAFGGPIEGLLAEIMGKSTGVCGGRGGSQHLSWGRFYSNGIQGGSAPVAAGAALALKSVGDSGVVCLFIGDGTLGEGALYEALNLVSLWRLPLLVVVEDNGYAQSTPKLLNLAGSMAARFEAFGIRVSELEANDPINITRITSSIIEEIRTDGCPQALILSTYRLVAHSKGDDNRDPTEIRLALERDPLNRLSQSLPVNILEDIRNSVSRTVAEAENLATMASDASVIDVMNDANEASVLAPLKPNRYKLPEFSKSARIVERINAALHAAMEQDVSVISIGEDIHDPYGGAFKATKGLSTRWPTRTFTTPISEAAITGLGAGVAMHGLKPVVEIMFGDFCTLITDQLINNATKFSWMYNGQVRVPMLVRTPMGGRRGYGPTHSQSLERIFFGVPGLRVVALSGLIDPALTVLECLSQEDPVLLIENKLQYARLLETPPKGWSLVTNEQPLSPIIVKHDSGRADLTIVVTPAMESIVLQAMTQLIEQEEIIVELISLREISPSEGALQIMLESAQSSGHVIIAEEGTLAWGMASEFCSLLAERLPGIRLRRVAAPLSPIPSSRSLEQQMLPSVESILLAAEEILLV